jgi:tetratricopeptide (TPR) repeat protein
MVLRRVGCLLTVGLAWTATHVWAAPQAAEKKPKDQQEYELINSVYKETDANKRLAMLEQWKQKYAETDYKEERLAYFMATYEQLNQLPKAIESARELLTVAPNNFGANFTLARLAPFSGSTDAALLGAARKAADWLLHAEKPAQVQDAQWPEVKKQATFIAHQAHGWTAMVEKKNEEAEHAFIKALEVSPGAAQVSYWLGTVVLAQKNPDKNTLALYSFARAAAYDGQGALTPAGRQQIDQYLTKIYRSYHGDESGLAELKQLAKAQPLPPPDLKIKSEVEIKAEKEEELRKSNPLLAIFLQIKEGLTGSDSAAFWGNMKGTAMPKLRGRVVSAKPGIRPKVVELAMSQSETAEISLATPETPPKCLIEAGADITFEGAEAVDFQPNPFLIKMQGGKILEGCREPPPPPKPAAKKAPKAVKK